MKLFYSWQSDTEEKYNRYFIQKALQTVKKDLSTEKVFELTIDQATRDEPGSPNISETILNKIDSSSLFLVDVTLINTKGNDKRTPNPNVLIELGYAIKKHGFEKIILLFNSAYGKVEELPFDIRQNRILQYNYNGENQQLSFDNLVNQLKTAILLIDKKTLSPNKIGITFYENNQNYGNSVSLNYEYTEKISQDEYLASVSIECLNKYQATKKRNSWQEFLLKLVDDQRKEHEALQRHGIYMHPIEIPGMSNPHYFDEYQTAALFRKNSIPLNFALLNTNENSFKNVKVVLSTSKDNRILRRGDMPDYPSNSPLLDSIAMSTLGIRSVYRIENKGDKISVECNIDLLHIGELYEFAEPLYLLLDPEQKGEVKINYSILFMDIPQINGELTLNINISKVKRFSGDELFEISY